MDREQFKNPGAEWRGKPFWSWNGKLDKDELLRQIKIFKEMGMGGYFCHSRTGLLTDYLGEEWFELIEACTQEGEKLGMESWLYDEDRWPSGTAGGIVTDEPAFRMHYLRMTVVKAVNFVPGDDYLAAYSVDLNGLSFSRQQQLDRSQIPKETHVLIFQVEEAGKSTFYNGNTYVDTMNKEATKYFLHRTHEKYRRYNGNHFGKEIHGIFTDEPHRGAVMCGFGVNNPNPFYLTPYTADLFVRFQERYGFSLQDHLAELFLRKDGEPVNRVKWCYMELIQELFLERFLQPIHNWCKENKMLLTGHLLHEDNLTAQAAMIGSVMRGYEYMDIPGVDVLGEHNSAWWIAKQVESSARQLGKRWILSELYGCTGWQMTFANHKAVGDWQALFGVNLRCHHLSWYTMQGEAKRDYPGSIFGQSSWAKEYAYVEDYFARVGMFMQQGVPECEVLVLNPVESVWSMIYPGWSSYLGISSPEVAELEDIYKRTFKMLCENHIDFDYGDEDYLARLGMVEKYKGSAALRVGKCFYRVVLVTGMRTIRSSTVCLLKEFVQSGGRVIVMGTPPDYIDACKSSGWEIESELIPFDPTGLTRAVNIKPPIDITDLSDVNDGSIFMQVRDDNGTFRAMLLNMDRDNQHSTHIRVHGAGWIEQWDARTGEGYLIASGEEPEFDYVFPPSGELLLTVNSSDKGLPFLAKTEIVDTVSLPNEFPYRLEEPNVCVLDFARWQIDDEPEETDTEVLKIDQKLRRRFGLPLRGWEMVQPWFSGKKHLPGLCKLKLEFDFTVESIPSELTLAMESPENFVVLINGKRLEMSLQNDRWVDSCFKQFHLDSSLLCIGCNTITLYTDFSEKTDIEAIYLLGSFGVALNGRQAKLIKAPDVLKVGDITGQGFPFYGAGLTYHLETLPEIQAGCQAWIKTENMSAACLTVENGSINNILAFPPYDMNISDLIYNGSLDITYKLTRRNTFGPLHQLPILPNQYGPASFITEGEQFISEGYGLIPQGMIHPIKILIKRPALNK